MGTIENKSIKPKKAHCITSGTPNTDQPEDIFDGEDKGEKPFGDVQHIAIGSIHRLHTIQHDNNDAEDDGDDQCFVKEFAGWGVRLEDDFLYPRSPTRQNSFLTTNMIFIILSSDRARTLLGTRRVLIDKNSQPPFLGRCRNLLLEIRSRMRR